MPSQLQTPPTATTTPSPSERLSSIAMVFRAIITCPSSLFSFTSPPSSLPLSSFSPFLPSSPFSFPVSHGTLPRTVLGPPSPLPHLVLSCNWCLRRSALTTSMQSMFGFSLFPSLPPSPSYLTPSPTHLPPSLPPLLPTSLLPPSLCSFLGPPDSPKTYIATQLPMENTVADFWR